MPPMDSNAPSGEAAATTYAVQDMDHLGLVAGMVDELGLVERIDSLIPQDLAQRNLSIGLVVKAMILNGLGFIQRVLYLMPSFFQNKPLDRLLGPGIRPEHLNDDVLGRALDAIYRFSTDAFDDILFSHRNIMRSFRTSCTTYFLTGPKSLILSAALLLLTLAGLALLAVDLHDTALVDGYAQCRAEFAPALDRLAQQDAALDEIEDQLILYAIFGKDMPTEAEYREAKKAVR